MKTISTTTLLVAILMLSGCDTSSDLVVNVPGNNSQSSLSKVCEYELIPLPEKSPLWVDSVFTMSKVIDGSVGGRMIMEKYYITEEGDSLIIEADLKIPPGAFQGTETITMTLDDEYAAFHFYPEKIFEDTLKFSQTFKGLHLEDYPTGTIDFVYIANDGSVEIIKKNGVQVITPLGLVRVNNAKLLHFSRYGWIRNTGSPIHIEPSPIND